MDVAVSLSSLTLSRSEDYSHQDSMLVENDDGSCNLLNHPDDTDIDGTFNKIQSDMDIDYEVDHNHSEPNVTQLTGFTEIVKENPESSIVACNPSFSTTKFSSSSKKSRHNLESSSQNSDIFASNPPSTPDHSTMNTYFLNSRKPNTTSHTLLYCLIRIISLSLGIFYNFLSWVLTVLESIFLFMANYSKSIVRIVLAAFFLWQLYLFYELTLQDYKAVIKDAYLQREEKQRGCQLSWEQNRCSPETRIPFLEESCRSFELCMREDPYDLPHRSTLAVRIVAQALEGLATALTWRTMGIVGVILLGLKLLGGWEFGGDVKAGRHRSLNPPIGRHEREARTLQQADESHRIFGHAKSGMKDAFESPGGFLRARRHGKHDTFLTSRSRRNEHPYHQVYHRHAAPSPVSSAPVYSNYRKGQGVIGILNASPERFWDDNFRDGDNSYCRYIGEF